ncbi:MAG: hypothetical protein WBD95_24000 [Xanthobacteraceae bacterium]
MDAKGIFIVALAGFAAFTTPARADTTIRSDDSSVEITVPNGWRQTKAATPRIQIQATNGRAVVVVRIVSKEDFKDLKSFASVGSSRFIKRFVDAEPKTEDIQVNGNPAIRISAEGTQDSGQRRGCVLTFIDAGGSFIEVMGVASASAFATEQQTMANLASKVKILAAAAAAPLAAPAAQTPAATPPTTTTPSTKQPPPARSPR